MEHKESQLQINCIKWLNMQFPQLAPLCFAIPNGHKRNAITASILKREGVRAGVSDLFFAKANIYEPKILKKEEIGFGKLTVYENMYASKPYGHGLFIEMKIGKGRQTDAQIAFEKAVTEQGYAYRVVRTFEEFKDLITNWLT